MSTRTANRIHTMTVAALDSLPCDTPGCGGLATRLVVRTLDEVPQPTLELTEANGWCGLLDAPQRPPSGGVLGGVTTAPMRSMLCERCCRRVFGWSDEDGQVSID